MLLEEAIDFEEPATTNESQTDIIEVLLFKICGVSMGVNLDEVWQIYSEGVAKAERKNIIRLNKKLKLNEDNANHATILLEPKGERGNRNSFIAIEEPDKIVNLDIAEIRRLPRFFEKLNISTDFWGVALINDKIVLLLDCGKIN